MSLLKKYVQELEDQGSVEALPAFLEFFINDVMIKFELKPMRKEFLKGYASFSKKFTHKELRKIALKSCAYYSAITDSVFLLINRFFPDEGSCVTTIVDIDGYDVFVNLRNDPFVDIIS